MSGQVFSYFTYNYSNSLFKGRDMSFWLRHYRNRVEPHRNRVFYREALGETHVSATARTPIYIIKKGPGGHQWLTPLVTFEGTPSSFLEF